MEADYQRTGHNDGVLSTDSSSICSLCGKRMNASHDIDNAHDDLDVMSICGDCKFLLLEDHDFTSPSPRLVRNHRGRRIRHMSSESLENLFSHMINLVGNSLPMTDDQSVEGDALTSSLTTPSGSRRWRRVLSDSESEGFENPDSLFGESERSYGFGRYGGFRGESDGFSFSDASVDGNSLLGTEIIFQQDEMNDTGSDTDIDPMNAGYSQWNLDDQEGEEEDDGEWDEAEVEEDLLEEHVRGQGQLPSFTISSSSEHNSPSDWHQQEQMPSGRGLIDWSRMTLNRDIFSNLEDSGLPQFLRVSGNYLASRAFEDLLEHLAESDNGRRGAPPAAVSFVKSLPRIIISEEHNKHKDLACAICKDGLHIGTEINQLPCLHLYHPSCILPWLQSRNSCPLCRYELPTDDKDYEEGKQNTSVRAEIQRQDMAEGSSSDVLDRVEVDDHVNIENTELSHVGPETSGSDRNGSRRGWLFLAAAPLVGLVGIVCVLWLGNRQGRDFNRYCSFPEIRPHQTRVPISSPPTSQRGNRSTRWWSFF